MARSDDLSQPRGAAGTRQYDPEAFGRFSEAIARFLGTARYLAFQTVFIALWFLLNGFRIIKIDLYPFIFMTLLLSLQAAYAAPLILLAQNRQTERDKAEIERDREVNARSLADTEFLAREMAAIRVSLERKVDRDDLAQAIARLAEALERSTGVRAPPDEGAASSGSTDPLAAPESGTGRDPPGA